jgi:hypothetical protein
MRFANFSRSVSPRKHFLAGRLPCLHHIVERPSGIRQVVQEFFLLYFSFRIPGAPLIRGVRMSGFHESQPSGPIWPVWVAQVSRCSRPGDFIIDHLHSVLSITARSWRWSNFRTYAYQEAGPIRLNDWSAHKLKFREAGWPRSRGFRDLGKCDTSLRESSHFAKLQLVGAPLI